MSLKSKCSEESSSSCKPYDITDPRLSSNYLSLAKEKLENQNISASAKRKASNDLNKRPTKIVRTPSHLDTKDQSFPKFTKEFIKSIEMMSGSMRGIEKYWQHYKAVEDWRKWHMDAYQLSSQCSRNAEANFTKENNYQLKGSGNYTNNLIDQNMSVDDENLDDSSDSGSNISLTFEVNDDMIAFFEQSIRHKMELRKERLLLAQNNDNNNPKENFTLENYDNSEKGDKSKPNNDNSSKKRKAEGAGGSTFKIPVPNVTADEEEKIKNMELLYGDAAPKIRGMETAVQLSFDRLCDVRKPVYWPCIPFRP